MLLYRPFYRRKLMFRFLSLAILFAFQFSFTELKLPAIFQDNMVLQQKSKAPIWGWAKPGEIITVTGSWGESAKTTVDKKGKWMVKIRTPKAGGPFTLIIKADKTITLKNVMSGEVWLCSGQSNMFFPVTKCIDGEKETSKAKYPGIRLFKISLAADIKEREDVEGTWKSVHLIL